MRILLATIGPRLHIFGFKGGLEQQFLTIRAIIEREGQDL